MGASSRHRQARDAPSKWRSSDLPAPELHREPPELPSCRGMNQPEGTTSAPPRPPPLRRKIARPGMVAMLVAALAALPLLGAVGMLSQGAQSSVLHVVVSFAALLLAFRLIGKRE